MNIAQLETVLNQQYSVKAMIDLAELSRSPGAVYKFFYGLHQDTFDPNDRIVIYTSHDIPDVLLKHLYDAASFVDISSWFVLLCAPVESTDSTVFQRFTAVLETTDVLENNYTLPETICAIPWMQLEVRGGGEIYPCCVMKNSSTIGNVQTITVQDAFYGESMNSLRKDLLDGKKPSICNACWALEDQGITSTRIHHIAKLKKKFLLEYLESPAITGIDIKFNNTCNFKCRICNPDSSSLVAAEHYKFLGIPIQSQAKWGESEKFIQEIIELSPHLSSIDMFGGEPFLIEKFSKVLQSTVDQGYAKNITLRYNSNGSIWPEKFIHLWKHFKTVDIYFSIDAVGRRFELQRGGSWLEVESNILRLKDLNFPNLNISLMPTLNIMSLYYIDEVYDWATKHNFKLVSNILLSPEHFSIKNLTKEAQDLIVEKFKNHPWADIQQMLAAIESTPASDGALFREKIKWFDSVRKENFSDSHPEIAKVMGYVYNSNV